ncbi:MAG TPA: exodeoxyribonuclease VII small subunit [Oscillatoriaceae cyanobacterium M33_DOE_052]|uniref:Exodeoxyribonuclease 7 small subunit n=1 Tax=Planktothricoides sp. SpSt-374 TaxID=2282167 RepID=A0A7C3ZSZ7_9CYAN|nr:exodeoxyribonuclease VII small subunit [Oscillatoriaceae cyanobacterium M33_DOE_052]
MSKSRQTPPNQWNYEETIAQVESLVAEIETGDIELEALFDKFTLAVESLRQCETFLDQRQKQMQLQIEILNDRAGQVE